MQMWRAATLGLATLASVLFGSPVVAGPAIPQPETALLVPGPMSGGSGIVGIRIDVPDGWHTYWRNPGDAGVPPRVTTDGSVNLKGVDLAFPAPVRYFDGFSTSIVYHDEVVLPMTVAAADPNAPVDLKLRIDFGYCKEICVPATASLAAVLAPDAPEDPQAKAAIDAALATVPVAEEDAPADAPTVSALRVDGESLEITVAAPGAAEALDLFADPPEGWYLSQPERREIGPEGGRFVLSLKGKPKAAPLSGAVFRFTIVGGGMPVEMQRSIP